MRQIARRNGTALLLAAACAACRDPATAPDDARAELADASSERADAPEAPDDPIEVEYSVAGAAPVRARLPLPDPNTGLMGFWARYERSGAVCRMLEAHLQGMQVAPRILVSLGDEGAWPTAAGPHTLSVSLSVPETCTPSGPCSVALRCRVAITQVGGGGRVVAGELVAPCAAPATVDGGVSVPAIELRALRFRALLRWYTTVTAPTPDASVPVPAEPCA